MGVISTNYGQLEVNQSLSGKHPKKTIELLSLLIIYYNRDHNQFDSETSASAA